jgi:membrane protease YdiL (CAAX protease family)
MLSPSIQAQLIHSRMDQITQKPLIRVRRFWVVCAFAIALAFVINAAFGDGTLSEVLIEGQPIAVQIGWGITFGLAISVPSMVVVFFVPLFSSLRRQLLDLVSRLDLGALNPLWISLSAGIGEELLFRGALQPILGIWWASFIFTVAHFRSGQFHSMNWQKLIYAASVFIAGLFLGYVFLENGLIAAMVTHAVVDVVSLFTARRWLRVYSLA